MEIEMSRCKDLSHVCFDYALSNLDRKEISASKSHKPEASGALAQSRGTLAPDIDSTFRAFSRAVFQEGALSKKTKQLIAVAVAHVTQCPYCIEGHSKAAARNGATPEEIMEAIWVAAEMRAGAAVAHSVLALNALDAAAKGD